jgi:hypothetical protein
MFEGKSMETKAQNQSKVYKGTNRSTKTRSKYQSRRRFRNIYHKSNRQPKIQ